MDSIKRRNINWLKTAKNLKILREYNDNLRKYVCFSLKFNDGDCSGNCDNCRFEMDHHISQSELAQVFNVTTSCVVNWENGKSKPGLEDLLFYSQLCNISLNEVVVYE